MTSLTNEELAVRVNQGDVTAKEILAEQNMGLVYHIAHKFKNTGEQFDDLVGQCLLGLTKTINTFKPEKGIKFATYASHIMTNEILMFLRKSKKYKNEVSIETQLASDEEGKSISIIDTMEDTSLESENDMDEVYLLLDEVLEQVSERDKEIVKTFMQDELTQSEISDKYNLSQSYISRIIQRVFRKLRWKAYHVGLLEVKPSGIKPKGVEEMKLDPKDLTQEMYEELRSEGKTNAEIGKLFGRSDTWVYAKIKGWEPCEKATAVKKDEEPTREAYQKLLKEKQLLENELRTAKEALRRVESVTITKQEDYTEASKLMNELTAVKDERDKLFMVIGKLVYENQLMQV